MFIQAYILFSNHNIKESNLPLDLVLLLSFDHRCSDNHSTFDIYLKHNLKIFSEHLLVLHSMARVPFFLRMKNVSCNVVMNSF